MKYGKESWVNFGPPRARTEDGLWVCDDVIGPSFLKGPGGFLGMSRDLYPKEGRVLFANGPKWAGLNGLSVTG